MRYFLYEDINNKYKPATRTKKCKIKILKEIWSCFLKLTVFIDSTSSDSSVTLKVTLCNKYTL